MFRKFEMMIHLYSIAFSLFLQIARGQENGRGTRNRSCASTPCSCCLQTATCEDNGFCNGECKDGIYGKKCFNNCPNKCVLCKKNFVTHEIRCQTCKPGYYSTLDLFQCQLPCSAGCKTCISAKHCTTCMAGYYKSGTSCSQCPTSCASCTSLSHCTQCADGYYYSGGVNGNFTCISCSYGCQAKCDKTSGFCNCRTHYIGQKCDRCFDGWYGTDCQQKCKAPCANCFSISNCTSCVNGYSLQGAVCCKTGCAECFSPDTCSKCIDGHYGIDCNLSCPANCDNIICERSTGHCNSCVSRFSGDRCCLDGPFCQSCLSDSECAECVDGMYGEHCEIRCPANCAGNICDKDVGTCATCLSGFKGGVCNISTSLKGTFRGLQTIIFFSVGGAVVVIVMLVAIYFCKRRCSCHDKEDSPKNQGRQEGQSNLPEGNVATFEEDMTNQGIELHDISQQPDVDTTLYENINMDIQTYQDHRNPKGCEVEENPYANMEMFRP